MAIITYPTQAIVENCLQQVSGNLTPLSLDALKEYYMNNGGKKKYCNYISSIDKLIKTVDKDQSVIKWLETAVDNSDPIEWLMTELDKLYKADSCKWKDSTKDDYKIGLRKFAQTLCGFFDAKIWLNKGKYDKLFCELIAENAIFADQEVVEKVKKGELGTVNNIRIKQELKEKYNNPYASWDYMEHYRDNNLAKNNKKEYRTIKEPDACFLKEFLTENAFVDDFLKKKVADDNTYANTYIKQAVLKSFSLKYGKNNFKIDYFKGYEACHIWDNPNDRRYYASIANLVLVPRNLAQLTDHNDAVKALLRNKVKEEFGLEPPKEKSLPKCKITIDKCKWRKI